MLSIASAFVLSLRHPAEEEDQALWTATFATNDLMRAYQKSKNDMLLAAAATWLPESVPAAQPDLVRAAARKALTMDNDRSRRFSIAIALQQSGADAEAERLLRDLEAEGFRPYRRSRGVSSVSYYLARALLHQHRRAEAVPLASPARREAPGDADVLALSVALGERQFMNELDALHDPFTRNLALAQASRLTSTQ